MQNLREKSKMIKAVCERKRKQMNGKFGLLNPHVRGISNTFSVGVIRFERYVEIFRLIFFFSLGLLPEFQAFCPKKFGTGGAAATYLSILVKYAATTDLTR